MARVGAANPQGHANGNFQSGNSQRVDFPGNPIPDLVLANIDSNNILIDPGLGNGQFGPSLDAGNGYFMGTNPMSITVANLFPGDPIPDLVVANEGSNDVSIFHGSGTGANWTSGPGERFKAGEGPASTVVARPVGSANPEILVSDRQSNQVQLIPGTGRGFFDDQHPTTIPVGGTAPVRSSSAISTRTRARWTW